MVPGKISTSKVFLLLSSPRVAFLPEGVVMSLNTQQLLSDYGLTLLMQIYQSSSDIK